MLYRVPPNIAGINKCMHVPTNISQQYICMAVIEYDNTALAFFVVLTIGMGNWQQQVTFVLFIHCYFI